MKENIFTLESFNALISQLETTHMATKNKPYREHAKVCSFCRFKATLAKDPSLSKAVVDRFIATLVETVDDPLVVFVLAIAKKSEQIFNIIIFALFLGYQLGLGQAEARQLEKELL